MSAGASRPPAGACRIVRADAIESSIVDHDWPFARENAGAIDAHWALLTAQKPALFNGRVFLASSWNVVAREGRSVLRSQHFETDFKAFIAWRDFGFPDGDVVNCFAAAALRGSDGAFVLVEMGAHTANAGLVYFPAGTPDPGDAGAGGRLDLDGSVLRELAEETGLAPPLVRPQGGWTLVCDGPRLACVREFASDLAGSELARRVEAHIDSEPEPELAGARCVRELDELDPARVPDYALVFLRWRLALRS